MFYIVMMLFMLSLDIPIDTPLRQYQDPFSLAEILHIISLDL